MVTTESVAPAGLIRGLREQITDFLRDDILCDRLAEGEPLREDKLAERFGVSRGPIREALAQLTQEGLLVAKPNCGVKVASSAPDSIRELIVPIRRTLETYALKLIFDDLTAEDFRKWDEILLRLELACRRKDTKAIILNDIALHRSILMRADQPDLLAIWQSIVARVRSQFWQETIQYKDPMDIHTEHKALVDVFRKKDREAALAALEEHIC